MTELPSTLPVVLRLAGRTCLVVGAGPVATQKVHDLLDAKALVRVVAPEISSGISDLARFSEFGLAVEQRSFREDDLDGVALVITATGIADVDAHVYDAAQRRGIWVNSADDPEHCNFFLTANVRRDPVVVSVSTSGSSPALAGYLRRRLERVLENELGQLALELAEVRNEIHTRGHSTMAHPWSSVIDDDLVAAATAGQWDDVRARIRTVAAVPV